METKTPPVLYKVFLFILNKWEQIMFTAFALAMIILSGLLMCAAHDMHKYENEVRIPFTQNVQIGDSVSVNDLHPIQGHILDIDEDSIVVIIKHPRNGLSPLSEK